MIALLNKDGFMPRSALIDLAILSAVAIIAAALIITLQVDDIRADLYLNDRF